MASRIISFITAIIIALTGFVSGLSENIKKLFHPEPPVTYFTTEDVQAKYGEAVRAIDQYADYGFADIQAEPLADLSFDDAADLSGYECNGARNQVPVELSKPVNEACNVFYRIWDYDSGTVLREGRLRFDRFETRKVIDVDQYDCDILIEISGVQNVALGENSFHCRKSN